MATKKAGKKGKPAKKAPGAPKTAVQEALEVTWVLKGHLKNAQISYIRVAALLVRVRDKKLYAELHHPDMESYAQERLGLGRSSLYRYLQVYDWIAASHKEWLAPKPKGFIPDLSDVGDLMWIERELARKDLHPEKRAQLADLRKKALEGQLKTADLRALRRREPRGEEALKVLLSKLRRIRKQAADMAGTPPDVLSHLDAAMDALRDRRTVALARIDLSVPYETAAFSPEFPSVSYS